METVTIGTPAHEGLARRARHLGDGRMDVGGSDEAESHPHHSCTIDRGVTLIDTAPVYGFGHAEKIVGKALDGGRRRRVLIATRFGSTGDAKPFRNATRARIMKEGRRFAAPAAHRRDRPYQVHWPDPKTPIEETAAAMDELRREGKIAQSA